MASPVAWSNRGSLVRYLASQLQRGRLALILGSGVSMPAGLPSWESLLERMFEDAGLSTPDFAKTEPEAAAETLKKTVFSGHDASFNEAVRTALYPPDVDLDFASLRGDAGLAALASLAMVSRRGSVSNVITFNFDDVLETYLGYHGFDVHSVAGDYAWANHADVEVLHPHGLLPSDANSKVSSRIIFTRSDYARVIGDNSNPWNQLALSIMRRNTCLFIGLQGRDGRLRSLLESVKVSHVARASRTLYWGVSFHDTDDPDTRALWQESGVSYQALGSYDELPDLLFEIAQVSASGLGNRELIMEKTSRRWR